MEITLYHYWRSSSSWRVRYALELKKIEYKQVAVNLLEREEKRPEYTKLNPNGYVPCLVVDGKALAESLAIIEWLEENFQKPSLFPKDSFARARVRQFAELINSGIQPLQNLDVTRKVSDDKLQQNQWMQYWIRRGLDACETILREHHANHDRFAFSDEPSLADICLIPQCYSAVRNEVDLSVYPIISSIYEYAKTTTEFRQSCPEAFQPVG